MEMQRNGERNALLTAVVTGPEPNRTEPDLTYITYNSPSVVMYEGETSNPNVAVGNARERNDWI